MGRNSEEYLWVVIETEGVLVELMIHVQGKVEFSLHTLNEWVYAWIPT